MNIYLCKSLLFRMDRLIKNLLLTIELRNEEIERLRGEVEELQNQIARRRNLDEDVEVLRAEVDELQNQIARIRNFYQQMANLRNNWEAHINNLNINNNSSGDDSN